MRIPIRIVTAIEPIFNLGSLQTRVIYLGEDDRIGGEGNKDSKMYANNLRGNAFYQRAMRWVQRG